ncbi:MAG: hypothetical protein IT569_06145 [Leptospiraceae bacterium]|nr:hypothetical protein [Leptospiraceae bacterium]
MKNIKIITGFFTTISICASLSLFFFGCSKKEKDPKIIEMEEKVQKISVESKLPVDSLEKIGIELDELQRACGMKYSKSPEKKEIREKKTLECRTNVRDELLKKNNIPLDKANDLMQAHMLLQWEWKYFQKEKKANLAKVQKIYSDGMAGMFQCAKLEAGPNEYKEALDRRVDICTEDKFYKICSEGGFDKDSCGKIISMGADYGWEMESEKKTQMINPIAPENKD